MEAVREARAEDRDACRALLAEALPVQEGAIDRLLEGEPTSKEAGPRVTFVGLYDGARVGIAIGRITRCREADVGVLDLCYVQPEARGVGVGGALVEAVVAWAQDAGATDVQASALPGDRSTKRLLESAGFTTQLLVLRRQAQPARGPA